MFIPLSSRKSKCAYALISSLYSPLATAESLRGIGSSEVLAAPQRSQLDESLSVVVAKSDLLRLRKRSRLVDVNGCVQPIFAAEFCLNGGDMR